MVACPVHAGRARWVQQKRDESEATHAIERGDGLSLRRDAAAERPAAREERQGMQPLAGLCDGCLNCRMCAAGEFTRLEPRSIYGNW
jgi:hypothetical protein